jgi:VWFA-related protein
MRNQLTVLALTLWASGSPLRGQEAERRLPPAESATVSVDVVVRDSKGQIVDDLTASDFEVFEDGVPQTVGPFERVFTSPPSTVAAPVEAPSSAPAANAAARLPAARPTTIAFVFDRLSTEGRVAAQRAARDYLRERGQDDVAGVFSVEETLVVLQDFTSDPALVLAGVEALGTRLAQSGSSRLEQARGTTGGRLAANLAQATVASIAHTNNPAQEASRAMAQIKATQLTMAQAAADSFERLARDEQGFATSHALTAIVDALRAVPGRKAVVLFSEGLFRTEATENLFLSVVHSANRASVSVYAALADGLQTKTLEFLTQMEITSAAKLSMARQASGDDAGGGAYMRGLEQTADMVRFNPRSSLEWIADSTGGILVHDTNDLTGAVRRISSDLRSYYVLGYTPTNDTFDGRFRKITVKVRRRGVDVRARSGYFAVRSTGPVLSHVAVPLALLEAGKRPRALTVYTGAWPFPAREGPARVPVMVSFPAASIARLASTRKGRLDITLLARIRSAHGGEPVETMSRRFLLEPGSKAEGDVSLLRDTWLSPGHYILEAVAYEAGSGQAGVVTADIEVEEGARALNRPQVMIVRGALPAGPAPADFETGHPLRFGDVVLQPLAGEPLPSKPARPLVFQVGALSPGAMPPGGSVTVWRGDRRVAETPVHWGAPDASGFRREVAEVPTSSLGAGRYELRLTLEDPSGERVVKAPFVIAN